MQYRSVYFVIYLGISSLSYHILTNLDRFPFLFPWYAALLETYGDVVKQAVAVAVVSGIALLFQTSNTIARVIVEGLPFSPLLRRMLSGRNFIEGDWPLVVVYGEKSPEPGKLLYYGFLAIDFRRDEFYVHGDDWTVDGVHAHYFESVRSSFHVDDNQRQLQYFYRQGQTSQDARMRGYTEIYFFPIYKRAALHAGEFRDIDHNDVRFYARRAAYGFWGKRLKSSEEKKAAAKQVWAEFQPQIKSMIAQPISADWN